MAREMKDSGIEWIGEIPLHWGITSLKHLCKMQAGKTLSSEQIAQEGQYPVYGGNGVRGFYKEFNNEGIYLLIGRQGALCGNVHKVDGKFWATEHAVLVRIFNGYDIYFMYYMLMSMNLNQYASNTAAQPGLAVSTILNVKACIPPIGEQQKIANFLDKKYIELDNVLEKTRASIEEYKKLKQVVISQAVTKGIRGNREMRDSGIEWIGKIPIEWKIIRIKWILNERKEKSEYGEEEPLSMSQKYGIIPTREMEIIPNIASSFIGAKIVYSGDLVFNKLKAYLGVFAVSQYNGLVSPDYAVYCSKGIADVKYLEYLFKTPQYIAEFKKRSSGVGAGLTRLYTDELYSIYCLLPSQDEQKEIICYLNKKIKEIDNLIEKKEQYLSEIENYKKSLIYEYVTGKKEV